MSVASGSASSSGTNASVAGGANKEGQNSSDDDSDDEDETATRELTSWRAAVSNATSASQLYLYLGQLHRCVAWEKSIMKVVSVAEQFNYFVMLKSGIFSELIVFYCYLFSLICHHSMTVYKLYSTVFQWFNMNYLM